MVWLESILLTISFYYLLNYGIGEWRWNYNNFVLKEGTYKTARKDI